MPLRLLIVDDNVHFLEAARGLLDGEGLSVIGVATTSEDGERLAAELEPDVMLVDIDLGEESGFDLATRITETKPDSTPQVILTSAYPEEDFAELIKASPALAFLAKSELSVSAIAALISRAGTEGEPDAT